MGHCSPPIIRKATGSMPGSRHYRDLTSPPRLPDVHTWPVASTAQRSVTDHFDRSLSDDANSSSWDGASVSKPRSIPIADLARFTVGVVDCVASYVRLLRWCTGSIWHVKCVGNLC